MKTLRYVGASTVRTITEEDFAGIGLPSPAVNIDTRTIEPNIVEVEDQAADYLLRFEVGDWEVVTEEELAAMKAEAEEDGEDTGELEIVFDDPEDPEA